MAYIRGKTLKHVLEEGPLPIEKAVLYSSQICDGLNAAHKLGIIHRDVKPSNILITNDEKVKIVDFGIARLPGVSQTKTGSLLGTLSYMSPEQARGEKVDIRTDVWSFGVVLFEMLSCQSHSRVPEEKLS